MVMIACSEEEELHIINYRHHHNPIRCTVNEKKRKVEKIVHIKKMCKVKRRNFSRHMSLYTHAFHIFRGKGNGQTFEMKTFSKFTLLTLDQMTFSYIYLN